MSLRDERWAEIGELLIDALDLPPGERPTFLDRVCGEDAGLRGELERLIAHEEAVESFLPHPIFSLHPPAAEIGLRVGAYRLVRLLGQGGMGAVYFAERADGELEQQVAIKLLAVSVMTAELRERFRSERQLLAKLGHPNVAQLLDAGTTDDGRPYFVMELVEGRRIDEYCAARGLDTRRRIELFRSVCAAVDFAHRNLIVHRDLKPGNVLVTEGGTVKLLDFGIARLVDAPVSGPEPMTARYASPEQRRGEPVSTASDVYSLGVLLQGLLTGEGIASDLAATVAKALQESPAQRYSSVDKLSEDLGRYLAGRPVEAHPPMLSYRAAKFLRRNALGVTVAAAIALLVIAVAAMTWVSQQRRRELDRLGSEISRERTLSTGVTDFLVGFLESADPSRTRGQKLTIQQAFDAAVARLGTDLEAAPELRATLLDAVGGVYRDLGLHPEARRHLEAALELRRATLGREHPLVAESLHNLANLELRLEDPEKAAALMRQAIALQRRAFPDGHRDLARGLNNLGAALRRQGRLDAAEPPVREALAMKQRLFGRDHPEVATSLNTLATIRKDRGDLAEAESLYRRAVEIRRGAEPESTEFATALNNLAMLLLDSGRAREALPLHEEALALRRKLHPDGHAQIVGSLNNLALVRLALGESETARALLEEAREMAQRLPGQPLLEVVEKSLGRVRG